MLEGGTGLRFAGLFLKILEYYFEPQKKKIAYVRVDFSMNTRIKLSSTHKHWAP
jgi:hypothetical protein